MCVLCVCCVPYAPGVGFVLFVLAVRGVLFLAPSLHHSVTQTRTCSAFLSHRNYFPGCVYATLRSSFRPFTCTPGLMIQCPSHFCFITFMETPTCPCFVRLSVNVCLLCVQCFPCVLCLLCASYVCRTIWESGACCVWLLSLCGVGWSCCASQCHAVPQLLSL